MKYCFLFVLLGAFEGTLHAQSLEGWTLRKNRDGVRVYTRQTSASKFAEIRVQCEYAGKLSHLVAALQDVPNHKEWAFNVQSARLLEHPRETVLTYHSIIATPWPVDSRDAVIRLQFSQDSLSRVLFVRGFNDPSRLPTQKGYVRVKESDSFWKVTPLPGARMQVDYILRLDPGGTLSPWVMNATMTTGPFQTFTRLRAAIQSPRYRNQHFAFLKE